MSRLSRWGGSFSSYVTVPVYAAFYRWLGHGEAIAEMCSAWEAKDRERAARAAPWELIEDMFILGTPAQMRERPGRVRRRRDHAADPHADHDPDKLGELIEALAP